MRADKIPNLLPEKKDEIVRIDPNCSSIDKLADGWNACRDTIAPKELVLDEDKTLKKMMASGVYNQNKNNKQWKFNEASLKGLVVRLSQAEGIIKVKE